MERTFGFELEYADAERSLIPLPDGYKYTDLPIGRMHNSDGSKVTHKGTHGGEINTRPLKYNKEDLRELEKVIKSIHDAGAYLLWNTGFDAHLYIADLPLDDIKKLFELSYWIAPHLKRLFDMAGWFENQYVCPSPTYDHVKKVNRVTSIDQISNIFSNASNRGHVRYYINLVPINHLGTIEFRIFNSSWDFGETMETIKFMYKYVAYARSHSVEDFKKLNSPQKCIEAFNINEKRIPKKQYPLLWASAHDDFASLVSELSIKSTLVMRRIGELSELYDRAMLVNSHYGDIEQVLSCKEITIYTKSLFMYSFWDIIINDAKIELKDGYEWMKLEEGTKAERLAKLMLFNKIRVANKENLYHNTMYKDYVKNYERYVSKNALKTVRIIERLADKKLSIHKGDIQNAISDNTGEVIIYQSEFSAKVNAADNGLAKHSELETFKYFSNYRDVDLSKFDYIVVSPNKYLPLEKNFRNKREYIYSNAPIIKRNFFTERETEPINYKLIPTDYVIKEDSEINFTRAGLKQLDYLRIKYLKQGIQLGTGLYNHFWFIDGYLFGATIFDYVTTGGSSNEVFMLSDFVIDTDVWRLSKFLISCTLSPEFNEELNRLFKNKVQGIYTVVFSEQPVSMKYRGVYKLTKREDGKLTYKQESGSVTKEEMMKKYLKTRK